MRKNQKTWEAICFRPTLPEGWDCLEQRGGSRYEETSYVRWGYGHHNEKEQRRFWVVFCEFNPNHWTNNNLGYRYTVRGGNDVKPEPKLRYFKNLKDAENYMVFLMESTDRWLAEINSQPYIDAYNRRIENMIKQKVK